MKMTRPLGLEIHELSLHGDALYDYCVFFSHQLILPTQDAGLDIPDKDAVKVMMSKFP